MLYFGIKYLNLLYHFRNKSNEADDSQRELRKLKFQSVISESRYTLQIF